MKNLITKIIIHACIVLYSYTGKAQSNIDFIVFYNNFPSDMSLGSFVLVKNEGFDEKNYYEETIFPTHITTLDSTCFIELAKYLQIVYEDDYKSYQLTNKPITRFEEKQKGLFTIHLGLKHENRTLPYEIIGIEDKYLGHSIIMSFYLFALKCNTCSFFETYEIINYIQSYERIILKDL